MCRYSSYRVFGRVPIWVQWALNSHLRRPFELLLLQYYSTFPNNECIELSLLLIASDSTMCGGGSPMWHSSKEGLTSKGHFLFNFPIFRYDLPLHRGSKKNRGRRDHFYSYYNLFNSKESHYPSSFTCSHYSHHTRSQLIFGFVPSKTLLAPSMALLLAASATLLASQYIRVQKQHTFLTPLKFLWKMIRKQSMSSKVFCRRIFIIAKGK